MEELMKKTKAGQSAPASETEPKKKFGLPMVDGEESNPVNEVNHLIDTGIGGINVLLRFADWYVLRSEHLQFGLADCATLETCCHDG